MEKSDRSWWYMKIKNKAGWVSCFYFEKESRVLERESALEIDSCKELVDNLGFFFFEARVSRSN